MIDGVSSEIQTEHLPNANPDYYRWNFSLQAKESQVKDRNREER
jgi:hypothetical protein